MSRSVHPNPKIEAAVKYAESTGWVVLRKGGHAWGILSCEQGPERGNCRLSVWSTPKNPETHAKQIRRKVDQCPH